MEHDTSASGKARPTPNAKIISRPGAATVHPAWPAEEPDPQFDTGTTRPVEISENENGTNAPTDGFAEELVMPPVDNTVMATNSAPISEQEEEKHMKEPQMGEPTAQDDAQEDAPAESSNVNDALTNVATEEAISEAKVMPDAVTDGNDAHYATDHAPVTSVEREVDPALTKEVATQAPAKTPQEYKQEFLSLMRVLTDDGSMEAKNQALSHFNSMIDQFKGMLLGKTQDEKATIVSFTLGAINPIMMKADALRAICLIIIGGLANDIKKDIPHGEWLETAKKCFPNTEPRELQRAMLLEKVRKAALYCHLGVTRLIKLAAIASKAPFSSADDPIGMVLSQVRGHMHILPEEYEVLAKAAIADNNLKKLELVIDPDVLREFYEYGEEITNNDIAELLAWKTRHDEDKNALTPTDFLRAALKNDGKRVFELTDPKEKDRKGKKKDVTPVIPDINSTFEKTRETIQLALDKLDPQNLKVDQELYNMLMATLKTFGETVFAS